MDGWPRTEEDLRFPVAQYLNHRALLVRHEVWINGRVADLFAFGPDETVAVELKLADWREAVVQAMAYQLGALHTYVAMPLDAAQRATGQVALFKKHGIGLLGVAPPMGGGFTPAHVHDPNAVPGLPSVRQLIEARPSDRLLPFLQEKIVKDAKRRKRVATTMPPEW